MSPLLVEPLGWLATVVFAGSYFCTRASALRRAQMAGAILWTAYGALVGSGPVVAANLLVFFAAAFTARRARLEASAADTVSPR